MGAWTRMASRAAFRNGQAHYCGYDMNAAVVEAAIPNMGLTFKSAQDARGELDTFYQLLYDFDLSMIGGAMPDDGLFYEG